MIIFIVLFSILIGFVSIFKKKLNNILVPLFLIILLFYAFRVVLRGGVMIPISNKPQYFKFIR